jgi:ornithine cyclodeaminase/alanine dehydrogenase-like protein (mu-crystallin family)
LRAVSSPEEAARGADIVSLATNALEPFFPAAWIRSGMHITTVRPSELMLDALLRCDLIAVLPARPPNSLHFRVKSEKFLSSAEGDYGRAELENTAADWRNKPELSEIMAGKVSGRKSDAEVTVYAQPLGTRSSVRRKRRENSPTGTGTKTGTRVAD